MNDINISKQELTTPANIAGKADDVVIRNATAIDFRTLVIHTNNTNGTKSAEVTFVYGDIVNGVFQELDLIKEDKEITVSIDQQTFEALAGSPLTPNEMSSNPHEIIYTRIVGYIKAQGIIK